MSTRSFSTQSWIETIARPAAVIRSDHTVEAANQLFLKTFGGRAELVGQPCYRVLHGSNRPCESRHFSCPLDRCLANLKSEQSVHLHTTEKSKSATKVVMKPLLRVSGASEDVLGTFEVLDYTRAGVDRHALVGQSEEFVAMLQQIEKAIHSTAPILLIGEGGTGKRFIAQAVHRACPWSKGLFETIDCRGIGEDRFQSRLLTCIESARIAAERFDWQATGPGPLGTLFLSQVNALSAPLQSQLLSALDLGMLGSLADATAPASELRLICSSDTELQQPVAEETFRRELAMWLSISPIRVPPLRSRRSDIPLLAESLLARADPRHRSHWLSEEAMEALRKYDFPGNIRELACTLERARLESPDRIIRPEALFIEEVQSHRVSPEPRLSFQGEIVSLRELNDTYLEWVSTLPYSNQRELARRLGVSERTLYRKLSRIRKQGSSGPLGEPRVPGVRGDSLTSP